MAAIGADGVPFENEEEVAFELDCWGASVVCEEEDEADADEAGAWACATAEVVSGGVLRAGVGCRGAAEDVDDEDDDEGGGGAIAP